MRILHLCNKVPFPGRDGSSIAMEALIRLEAALGHEVHVIALNTEKHWVEAPQAPFAHVVLEAIPVRTAPHWTTALRNLGTRQSYYASRFWDPKVAQRIAECASRADLVVIDSLFMAVYLDVLGSAPRILRAHNVEHAIWLRGLREEPLLKRAYVALQAARLARWEREVAQHVDRIWTISEEDRAWFIQHSTCPTTAIPCSADAANGPWIFSGAASPLAYHLGALDWTPNVRGMQWFLDEVVPHLRHAQVDVFSRQWPFAPAQLPVRYRSEACTEFENYGLFLAPIRSGSGMRIKLLEAMMRGKAIVTTSLGAEGLKAEHGTHLLLADSAADFAAALDLLATDEARRTAMGRAAADHARAHFADEVVAQRVARDLATFTP